MVKNIIHFYFPRKGHMMGLQCNFTAIEQVSSLRLRSNL
jgi:hypothetical protein